MNQQESAQISSTMKLGAIVFPQVEELDFIGPREMFTLWKQVEAAATPIRVDPPFVLRRLVTEVTDNQTLS